MGEFVVGFTGDKKNSETIMDRICGVFASYGSYSTKIIERDGKTYVKFSPPRRKKVVRDSDTKEANIG